MVAFGGGAIASKLTGLFQFYDQALFVAFSSEDNDSLWSNFSFFSLSVIFSNFWMVLKRRHQSIRKGSKFS